MFWGQFKAILYKNFLLSFRAHEFLKTLVLTEIMVLLTYFTESLNIFYFSTPVILYSQLISLAWVGER